MLDQEHKKLNETVFDIENEVLGQTDSNYEKLLAKDYYLI